MSTWYRQGPGNISRAQWLNDIIVASLHQATEVAVNLDTSAYVSQITAELANGAGYATGGTTLTQKTAAYLTAAQWGLAPTVSTAVTAGAMMQTGGNIHRAITGGTTAATAPTYATAIGSTTTDGPVTWLMEGAGSMIAAVSTPYTSGYVVRPVTGNGFLYRTVVAGTSAATAPAWPTVAGTTVVDGSVTWECLGGGLIIFAAGNPFWNSATFTGARFCILSDRTPTGAAAQPLLGLTDYGSAQSGQGGTFTQQFQAEGCLFVAAA